MTFTYASASTVAQAAKADASIAGMWATAYADAANDIDRGGNLRDMAAAITKAGTKCSKDTAGDYVLAHSLTVHGGYFADALADRIGEGKVMRAHSLIAKARKARGVAYVRSVLASLDGHEDTDALAKALAKAVRELDAAKRQTPDTGDTGEGVEGEGVESGEGETVEGVETVVPTVDAMLAAVVGPTAKLVEAIESGQFPTDADALDRWLMAVGRIAQAVKAAKAAA